MHRNLKKMFAVIGLSAALLSVPLSAHALGNANSYDMDKNGTTDITDCTYLQLYLAGYDNPIDPSIADVNQDGKINILDVTQLQLLLAELDFSPTVPPEIKLNTEQLTLGAGEQYSLHTVNTGDQNCTYTTSNPVVASVTADGTITALSKGTATITVTAESGAGANCTLTVKDAPDKVTLNISEISLGLGEEYIISESTNSGSYAYNFTWTSDNENVAAVERTVSNQAKISANGVGTANITVTTYNGISAKCTVTVGKMADSISLNAENLTLGIGETFDLNSSIPSGATAYYRIYTSNNTQVAAAEASGGLITAKSVGTAEITCTMANGVTAACKITVREAPASVTLSQSETTLKVGEEFIIAESTNSGSYARSFSWSNSNSKVLSIEAVKGTNKCKIKPKMQGTAVITVTTYNNKKAACKVTVAGSVVKAIDVSTWQGNINFSKVKSSGYDYVLIRAGYGRETYQKDDMFETNYKNAKKAGLKIGVYWYSYADSISDAEKEAQACLYCLNNKDLDLPVYIDFEESWQQSLGKSYLTQMAEKFCSTIENNNYQAGVYANSYWFNYFLNKQELSKKYSIWFAQIDGDMSNIQADIHQYTWTGKVNGISGNVDCDYIYNLNIVR